jgi:selenide,water dikinase
MGVIDITGLLVFEAFPYAMPHEIAVDLLRGFYDFSKDLNAPVIGGHTIINPWPLLGGTAIGISHPDKITYSSGAKPGDCLILTKPLGTQPAMAVYRLLRDPEISIEELFPNISLKELKECPDLAIKVMLTSNKPVAEIIHEISINAATDVTGFGLFGHAQEIAERSNVKIVIEQIPVINHCVEISNILGYGLDKGVSAETAGGMLLSIPANKIDLIKTELKKKKISSFEIGKVLSGPATTILSKDIKIQSIKAV